MRSKRLKLEALTRGQGAALQAHATDWAERTRDNTPLTAAERREVEAAIARCFRAAGLPWHGVVRWASSPLEAELAALSCAAKLCTLRRSGRLQESRLTVARLQCVQWKLRQQRKLIWLRQALKQTAQSSASFALVGALAGALIGLDLGVLYGNYWERLWALVSQGGVLVAIGAGVGFLAGFVAWSPFCAAGERAAMWGTFNAVAVSGWSGLHLAAWLAGTNIPARAHGFREVLATIMHTAAAMSGCFALPAAPVAFIKQYKAREIDIRLVDDAADQLRRAHAKAARKVTRHVASSVVETVRQQLRLRVADPREAVRTSIARAPNDESVRRGARALVANIVSRCLTGPIPLGVGDLEPDAYAQYVVSQLDGQLQGCELAEIAFYRQQLPALRGKHLTLLDHFEAANRAGPWWAARDFVIISERHQCLYAQGSTLHRADGPALAWPGFQLYYSHGLSIERSIIERTWQAAEIRALDHVQRRAVIEHLGWPRYLALTRAREIARADDPGNPGRTLALFEAPDPYTQSFRILVMINGSPEPNGEYRMFGEPVPSWIQRPIEAAAWAYNCPEDVYRQLHRRT